MNGSETSRIELAPGFEFTDKLTSSYRLTYGHSNSPCSAVYVSRVDGSQRQELLPEDDQRRQMTLCFSPDGSTMYRYEGRLFAYDLATNTVQTLQGIPKNPPVEQTKLLKVSPDNRFLLCTQTAEPQMVRGRGKVSPVRLCRINTDGTGFRVLYEDPPAYYLTQIAFCWPREFALLHRSNQGMETKREELWKVNLNTGALEFVGHPPEIRWNLVVHPGGEQVAWTANRVGTPYVRGRIIKRLTLANLNEEICLGTLDENETKYQCVTVGTCPAWSPDGKRLAFMKDQHCLALWDRESGQFQELVWFESPNLTCAQRQGQSFAVAPVWSPDGQMLWFSLTQTRKMPFPTNLAERVDYACQRIYPFFHNINPKRTSFHVGYRHQYYAFRTGIADLRTKQIMITKGFAYGTNWLPGTSV